MSFGRHLLSLLEQSPSEGERGFSVSTDGAPQHGFRLLECYTPGLCVNPPRVTLWGGMKFFILNVESQEWGEFESEDELHAVYDLDGLLCLVGEASVSLFDVAGRVIVARYRHSEVILGNYWQGDLLVIEDFQGGKLCFEVTPHGTELRPRELGAS